MNNAPPQLTFVRDLFDSFETRHQHARAVRARAERRVARGVYMDATDWAALDDDEKYAARVRAIALTRTHRPVLSHWSAAVIHGLPVVGNWPTDVHSTAPMAGGRSRAGVVRHAKRLDEADVVEVDGLQLTSVARTVIDMATIASRGCAIAMADRALLVDRFSRRDPLTTRDELLATWNRMLPFRGHMRALEVIEFAEDRSESVLESVSRVTMRVIGCPPPRLQIPFYDSDGFIAEPDFSWEKFGIVGEADGEAKYRDARLRGGRSAEQVVIDEKNREDRLRARGFTVCRWGWKVATDPELLRARLSTAGLPVGIPSRRTRRR